MNGESSVAEFFQALGGASLFVLSEKIILRKYDADKINLLLLN